ncbi:MAG: DUF503 domain-containing protein [Halomonas sp.]|uniref:DUF503 domain-containing protein n=1 Tax=Halomonas sp. TaxID=1486246 RepID=UPI0019FCD683|nr:DUF503 domain-containing protein [Halomonas sp.]MBE0489678.1 DUF503 domain-containing protein [Halomonas sp.]
MHMGILTLHISLPGCRSLKEKRQRMGGLHERFGRNPAVAVCESGEHDRLEASEWTFVAVANEGPRVETLLGAHELTIRVLLRSRRDEREDERE